ncbi:hypothetical protein ACFVIM_22770 [Streptomyces sp. NPDC057638]|uniref:hypothetical protein n=1 Tax=Streptomyces sp. NPDC057638 TaxID=3346190 RepID=UPI0036C1F47C
MPTRRHPPLAAIALLGMVLALLVAVCAPAYAVPAPPGDGTAVVVAAPGQAPGCGDGAPDGDRGAQPATPPRAGGAGELAPPLPCPGSGAPAPLWTLLAPGITPDRGPPPLDPPTPVDLSVLRV